MKSCSFVLYLGKIANQVYDVQNWEARGRKESIIHTLSLPDRRYSDVHADVGKRFVNQIK